MNRTLFCEIGFCLYGPLWQSEMSRQLNVADRTVQRWVKGESPIPDGVKLNLKRLVLQHEKTLVRVKKELLTAIDRMS